MDIEKIKSNLDNIFAHSDVSENERNKITNCLDEFKNPQYLEIGVYYGGTIFHVLNYLKQSKKNFYCCGVDLFEDLAQQNENYIKRFQEGIDTQTHVVFRHGYEIEPFKLNGSVMNDLKEKLNINGFSDNDFSLFKGQSDDVLPKLDKIFDVIFIDGNHSYIQVKEDYENCFKYLSKIGTYFIFHNATEAEVEIYKDGGPYKLCEELKNNLNLSHVLDCDYTKIFKRIQ